MQQFSMPWKWREFDENADEGGEGWAIKRPVVDRYRVRIPVW